MGVGMENPTPVQKFTYLEPDSIISPLSTREKKTALSRVIAREKRP